MILTYEQILNRIAEKTIDNTRQLRRGVQQRRNGMEDLYGMVYNVNGDANHPATFYVSVSPNLVYYEQFAFKFIVEPFMSSVSEGTGSAVVSVDNTSLTIDESTTPSKVTPNPHKHTTQPHTHNMVSGVSFAPTTSTYWRVRIHGVDITPYLMEQHDGAWIDGEGIFPNQLMTQKGFYDILDVASLLDAEGDITNRDKLLMPEFKKVEVVSDAPFNLTAFLFLKYSNLNR